MQTYQSLAIAALASLTAATVQDPTVSLSTYRAAPDGVCDDKYLTAPSSTLVSPPVGECVALPPQTNAIQYRVMAGEITPDCQLQVYAIPDCRTKTEGFTIYGVESGDLKCETDVFAPNELQAQSAVVLCPGMEGYISLPQ